MTLSRTNHRTKNADGRPRGHGGVLAIRPTTATITSSLCAIVLFLLPACQAKPPDALPPGKGLAAKPATEPPNDVLRAIAPGTTHQIYPILKAWDWPAKEFSVSEPFAGTDKPPVPLIAYGYETDDHYIFVGKADLASRSLAEIKREALANIEKYPVAWQAITSHVLTASGKDFSAEKILSMEFLIEAQHRLNAKSILVGIPRRTVIYAADGGAPKDALEMFYRVFRHTYEDDSFGAPITNLLFEYRNGALIGAKAIEAKN
jgi:uncharacterized protein YtpQ (UPF0354 family)